MRVEANEECIDEFQMDDGSGRNSGASLFSRDIHHAWAPSHARHAMAAGTKE